MIPRSLVLSFACAAMLAACSSNGPKAENLGETGEDLMVKCGASASGAVQGRDVSYYQGNFNWKAAGVQFGYARISDGTGFIDPDFDANWANMKAAGIMRGAYQFFEPGEDATAQADLVIKKVGKLGPNDLPVQFDVEVTGGQSPATIQAAAKKWLALVEAGTGKRPFIYSYGSFLETNLGSGFGAWPLWIAAYGVTCPSIPNGWTNWVMWQYSDGGGALDHDVYNGTLAQLQSLANANTPAKGYLDNATCTAMTGWAQDPNVPTKAIGVDVYFDAPMGANGSLGPVRIDASVNRADLCKPLGSCNHGFSTAPPVGVLDGAAHKVFAYGVDSTGMGTTLLTNAPKSMTCQPPAIPATTMQGEKRWITSPTILAAWKLNDTLNIAHEPAATVAAYVKGPDLPAKPEVIMADDGSSAVWVVDGNERRHVVSPASMTAWQLTAPKTKTPAAQVNAMPVGADWPNAPFVFQGDGAPQVYVLDSAPGQPPVTGAGGGTSGDGSDPMVTPDPTTTPGDPVASGGGGGGCAVSSAHHEGGTDNRGEQLLLALGALALIARARQTRKARA